MSLKLGLSKQSKIEEYLYKQLDPNDPLQLNLIELKEYIYSGFNITKKRSKFWRVLLGYHVNNKFKLEFYYKKHRNAYLQYLMDIKHLDDIYFKVLENDISRTFYNNYNNIHYKEALTRILKCFVIHNKSVGYLQGMIMLLIPIYTVFIKEEPEFCEADSFFCFNSLMSEIYENFMYSITNISSINDLIHKVIYIIKEVDFELYNLCIIKGYFQTSICIRWIFFLFSTEYKLKELMWFWDKLFSDVDRFELVFYCAAAVYKILKSRLIYESFEQVIKLLENIAHIEIETLFIIADGMRKSLYKKDEKFLSLFN